MCIKLHEGTPNARLFGEQRNFVRFLFTLEVTKRTVLVISLHSAVPHAPRAHDLTFENGDVEMKGAAIGHKSVVFWRSGGQCLFETFLIAEKHWLQATRRTGMLPPLFEAWRAEIFGGFLVFGNPSGQC